MSRFPFLLFSILYFCLASCAHRDPHGGRTLAAYERPGGKKLLIEYVDQGTKNNPSIQVVLTADNHSDSVLAKFEYNYMQFSHLQPNSNLIIAIRKDTTSVNLDTYKVKIPE